jgi:hypothetical protein
MVFVRRRIAIEKMHIIFKGQSEVGSPIQRPASFMTPKEEWASYRALGFLSCHASPKSKLTMFERRRACGCGYPTCASPAL